VTARFSTAEVLEACGARLLGAGAGRLFEGVSTDTRSIAPGSLFVALKGERFDAHEFLVEAAARGAAEEDGDKEAGGKQSATHWGSALG